MTTYEIGQANEAQERVSQDVLGTFTFQHSTTLAIADGAGGTGSGLEAARVVIRSVSQSAECVLSERMWTQRLLQIDNQVGPGQSTAVVVQLLPDGIVGASVGDSVAWIIDHEDLIDLTDCQNRKPLLGTGEAKPVGFHHGPLHGVLVLASDGFANYVKRDDVVRLVNEEWFPVLATRLVGLARLHSGKWADDTSVVICRVRPTMHSRKRYEIHDVAE